MRLYKGNTGLFSASASVRSTALCGLAALLILPATAGAFDPNSGAEPAVQYNRVRSQLPSTASVGGPLPQVTFPESSARRAPVENQSSAASLTPVYPPVDAATAARAQQELQADHVSSEIAMPSSPDTLQAFVAPAPLMTPVENPPMAPALLPEPLAAPDALTQPAMTAELYSAPEGLEPIQLVNPADVPGAESLSADSKKVLSTVPSRIDASKYGKGGKLAIKRMTPEIQSLATKTEIGSYDSAGLSIKVQRPGLDSNFELNRAYNAMLGGEPGEAIAIYKNVLTAEPENEDALFGVAALYHRIGDLDKARPYYARLLKVNPDHRDGLNNFLALISDEAPQEALAELERLEQRNPDFSPIPAQQALVLKKLGYMDRAQDKMIRAIELSPENLSYKYNLAVMLDATGHYADAGAFYRLLIDAALKGEKVPVSVETLQKRLNFIAAAPAPVAAIGG